MITLFRLWKLWTLKVKWELALFQFLDQQLKNPEELQQKIVHEIAEIVHKANESNS